MRIYLDGVEYKAYREIMQNLGVRFGCLNYEYIWARTPRFSLSEDTEFLDELMVYPGNLRREFYSDYEEFLNQNSQYISFALSPYEIDTEVNIIPLEKDLVYYLTFDSVSKPFAKIQQKKAAENGAIIHGLGFEWPFLSSFNSNLWMRGRQHLYSRFKNDKMVWGFNMYASSIARELIAEGYDLDLIKIKREDWKELAKMNCVSWVKYQEFYERN